MKKEKVRIKVRLTKEEKEKLMSGNGFVKVPTEELKRLRVDVYPYVM